MKIFFVLTLSFILTGCIGVNSSKFDLISNGKNSGKICSAKPVEIISDAVEAYIKKCFAWRPPSRNYVVVNHYVTKNELENGTEYLVYTGLKGKENYVLSVDVEEGGGQCESTINSYAYNIFWVKHFKKLESISKLESVKCPIL